MKLTVRMQRRGLLGLLYLLMAMALVLLQASEVLAWSGDSSGNTAACTATSSDVSSQAAADNASRDAAWQSGDNIDGTIGTANDSFAKEPVIDPNVKSTPGFGNWWANVQKDINNQEYHPSLQTQDSQGNTFVEPAWHFTNRANNLRSYISPEGWLLEPRESAGNESSWQWLYTLESLGRDTQAVSFSAPDNKDISADEASTVSIDRNILTEWYKNSEAGTEQGFTIKDKPQGDGSLKLSAKISTDLIVSSFSQDQITFSTGKADVIKLGGLKVYDADNKELSADFIYNAGQSTITISINDSSAVYPIVIDPLASSPAWTAESDQAYAYFGFSVASAGDVNGDGYSDVIVGAPYYDNGQHTIFLK